MSIDPNVEVRFAQNTSLIVYGTLTAVGTPVGTITFTASSTTPSAGFWQSIKFSGANAKGTISYCNIGYAKQAVYLENTSGIVIINNFIHDNKGNDGYWYWFWATSGEVGCGIYLIGASSNTISANTIFKNQGGNGGNGIAPGDGYGGSGGIGCGIFLDNSNYNYSAFNILYGNKGGKGGDSPNYWHSSGGRGGIGCGIYISNSRNNVLLQNYISKSERGERGVGDTANAGEASYGAFGNAYGIYIDPNSYNNTVTSSNSYNSEPIYYYYNQSGITIENQNLTLVGSGSTNLGRIVLINCLEFIIKNNSIVGGIGENGCTQGGQGEPGKQGNGIYLFSSTNTIISNNIISNNIGGKGGTVGEGGGVGGRGGTGTGVFIKDSSNIKLNNNTIFNNIAGEGGGHGALGSTFGKGGEGMGILIIDSNVEIERNEVKINKGAWGIPSGKGYGIYSCSSSNPEIHCNNLFGNKNGDLTKGYGVYHDGSTGTISATFNWWGHNSGPEHPITNPSGQGDKVSDWVDYWPWTAITLVNPNSGPIGTIVTIEGQGFTTQTQVFIDFGTHPTIAARESSITGTFSITFMVDTQPVCTKVITARNEYGKSATTLFKLMSGVLGISLRKECPSFALSQSTITYTLYYKNTGTTVLSDVFLKDQLPNGSIQTFSLGLLNPNQEGSTTIKYFIQKQGSSTITNYATITGTSEVSCAEGVVTAYASCSTHVTFIPEITNLTPTSGPIGTIITIQGQNFATNSLISIDFGTHLT
ncbi:MAG: IPT/TIG domain-containing protein, partial [bacterium]